MSPEISAARREQSPAPPAKRVAWFCPYCPGGRREPHGYAQNITAAMTAGVRHFTDHHDTTERAP